MFGWFATNKDTKELIAKYNLKLAGEKNYKKVYADYEIVENIWRKKTKKK
jgi:hypothetical protein